MTMVGRGLIVEVIGQTSLQKMCLKWVYTAAPYEYWFTAVVVGFHCNVIGCETKTAATTQSSARGPGNAVGLTSRAEFELLQALERVKNDVLADGIG